MPGKAHRFRFPTHVEIRYLDEPPQPGQIVVGAGHEWVVRSVERHSAYTVCDLELAGSEEVAAHGAPGEGVADDAERDLVAWGIGTSRARVHIDDDGLTPPAA